MLFKTSDNQLDYIIVGLGNPGIRYACTKHNIGFCAVDSIYSGIGTEIKRLKFHALTEKSEFAGRKVLFVKPQTYMNESGTAIAEAASFYKIPPERILVIFDDVSLEPGVIRIRKNGSAGGHNGLKSIIEHMGSDGFPRIKIGIGQKPYPDSDLADYVLAPFSPENRKLITARFDDVKEAAALIVNGDMDKAMNLFNSKQK